MSETPNGAPNTKPGAPVTVADAATDHPKQSSSQTGIVVGVDDSHSARAAVAWAATEANRRSLGLHLVEVLPSVGASRAETGVPHGRARALLLRAQGIARAISPGLAVSMETLSGRVGPALVDYAAQARLLVVGSNGPGGPIPVSLGSILGKVTAHAACPVVLVPAPVTRSRASEGPVLVALDVASHGGDALAFAAEAAHQRGVALVALSVAKSSARAGWFEEHELSTKESARLRGQYPGLTLRTQTVHGPPADALLRANPDAQLIVVPSRQRGTGRVGASTGWTGRFLPVLSACPVAVVPTHPRTDTQA